MRKALWSSDIGSGSSVVDDMSEEIEVLGGGEGNDVGRAVVDLDESVSRVATPFLYCRALP